MLKFKQIKKGPRAHDNKVVGIYEGTNLIGSIEFAYGRSDSADHWSIWDCVVIFKGEGHQVNLQKVLNMNYVQYRKALSFLKTQITEDKLGEISKPCDVNTRCYGSDTDLNYKVLSSLNAKFR